MMKKIIIIVVVLILLIVAYLIFAKITSENELTPNEDGYIITEFSLSESSSNAMAENGARESYYFSLYENSLEIETTELGERIIIELDKTERENIEQELLKLIETHSLNKWDGYDEWVDVLDVFHSFSFSVTYANGKEIYAQGDHAFPDNYKTVFEDVKAIFEGYLSDE